MAGNDVWRLCEKCRYAIIAEAATIKVWAERA
jgi:hypothetical protein